MKETINVVFCIDTSYTQHLGVALASLLIHNRAEDVSVFIVSSKLDPADIAKLSSIGSIFGVSLEFRQVDDERAAGFRECFHFSRAAYFRLLLPDILPEIDKIIYLDCDLVVEAHLQELWETEVSSCGCAGLAEGASSNVSRIGIEPDFYINSGVLVLNLRYWRDNDTGSKCLSWLDANPQLAIFPDQDAINVVLREQKAEIDVKWNLNPAPADVDSLLKQYPSRILHFAGVLKPWHKCYDFKLQAIYLKYLHLTPWSVDFSLEEPTNVGQACLVGNQLFKQNDFKAACTYYHQAINFRLKTHKLESKLLLDCINGGYRHFGNQDYFSACEHYRSCLEHWGFPIVYDSVYRMPGIHEGVY